MNTLSAQIFLKVVKYSEISDTIQIKGMPTNQMGQDGALS